MISPQRIFQGRKLLLFLSLLLSATFFATTLSSYFVSRQAIRDAIISSELPLTSSNIYSEIQRDLVRPILISSTMASDTFMRDWVLKGEQNVDDMARYLREVKARYGAFSSFFVSERSHRYYTGEGVIKAVKNSEPRDAWYFRVRDMKEDYEINVDPDMANKDALTIFINYRVFDFSGKYLGATGIGLTVDAVRDLIASYQERFKRTIYFVDQEGKVVLFGNQSGRSGQDLDLNLATGIGPLMPGILANKHGSFTYQGAQGNHLLNVNYIPELKWYLFVEKIEDDALQDIRKTLYINLIACFAVTLLVLLITHWSLNRYQRRIESMASTDKLTGLLNRQAFDLLIRKLAPEIRRDALPVAILMGDIDHFKAINDQYGHPVGDAVLVTVADRLQARLRESDIAVRWGGEEFLIVLKNCTPDEALLLAESLRADIAMASFASAGYKEPVTLSFGISTFDGVETVEHAIGRADEALYDAKRGGRNRVSVSRASL